MDILRRNIFQIDLIDLAADLHITRHLRRRNNIVQRQRRILFQIRSLAGCSRKLVPRSILPAPGIDFPDLLHHLKQPRPSRDIISLQRRGDRKADGLLRPAFIRHYQICSQRVKSPFHALHGSIE